MEEAGVHMKVFECAKRGTTRREFEFGDFVNFAILLLLELLLYLIVIIHYFVKQGRKVKP
jgi:hypothetical protein